MKSLWFAHREGPTIQASGRGALLALGTISLAALTLFLMFWNLGSNSISHTSDEVIYVRVSQAVLHDGSYFPLMHGNVPTFEKPPLKLWLGALAPLLLGESNLSFRLLDGALGVWAVLCSVLLSWRISRSLAGALVVGFLLLGMPEWIIAQHGFRKAVLDGLLTVLTLGVALTTWNASELDERSKSKWLFWIGVFSSLAVVTKSVAGFVPLACAVCSIAILAPRRLLTRHSIWLLLPVVVFGAYVLAVWQAGGARGLRMFLGVEIVDRAFSGFEGHNTGSSWFYIWYLFSRGGAAPRWLLWMGLAGAALIAGKDRRMRYLLVWSVLPVGAYSLSASRAPWYIAPFFPFVCMLAVFGSSAFVTLVRSWSPLRWMGSIVCVGALTLSVNAYSRSIVRNMREVSTDTRRLSIDLLTERLRAEYNKFGVVESAVSARSNPRQGRFNVEGIYRETLKPDLLVVATMAELRPESRRGYFVKESALPALPPGWSEVGRLTPGFSREWQVIAVVYP